MDVDSLRNPDWSELQQKLVQDTVPMLFGSPNVVDGYCRFELIERGVMLYSLGEFSGAVELWYRAISLIEEPFKNTLNLMEDAAKRTSHLTQLRLLTLSLSTSKSALDLHLRGHYSLSLAALRHQLETTIQVIYLASFPGQAFRWEVNSNTPSVRQMTDQLQKRMKADPSASGHLHKMTGIYDQWSFLSKGSHPSGFGLTQIEDPEDGTRYILGTQYRHDLAAIGFVSGLQVQDTLLLAQRLIVSPTPEWGDLVIEWIESSRRLSQAIKADTRVADLWQDSADHEEPQNCDLPEETVD